MDIPRDAKRKLSSEDGSAVDSEARRRRVKAWNDTHAQGTSSDHDPQNSSPPEPDGPDGSDEERGNEGDGEDDNCDYEEEEEEEEDPTSARAKVEDEEDTDPLEAFMSELDSGEEIVQQESINSLSSQGVVQAVESQTSASSNTITLEELMSMTTSGNSGQGGEGWESDVKAEITDDEGDEETQERDRNDFMRAIRSMHGSGGIDYEDEQAGVVATSSSSESSSLSRSLPPAPVRGEGAAGDSIVSSDTAASASATARIGDDEVTPGSPPTSAAASNLAGKPGGGKQDGGALGRIFVDEGDVMEEHEREDQERSALDLLQEAIKKKDLAQVDHSLVDYLKVRKNLYVVPRSLGHLAKPGAEPALAARREKLAIKVRGKGCPPPVDSWEHCGLSDRVLNQLKKIYGDESAPFAIQQQGIPAIMSGRDVIGIAKTGSGKTLAFILPMIRHIMDQPELGEGVTGPIGLILAPARELALQIFKEAKKFTKALNLRVTAVYGGAGVADQIGELKRGAEIVVCTPGRMIDILTMQAGKLISLSRVSFVVLDEADRMFDMGFEPQIRMVLQNIRPDRQTCLFSATFPQKVEALARKVLTAPVEIVVGGRSVANTAITQYAEVRSEGDKFMRLLQLLGVWFERGHILIFTDTQARCERLFEDLMRAGYPCLSLHGGKEQIDRDDAIASFKNKVRTLMVATSVAGRGLDVPDLCCVINYSCPNHLEDYVHRVGRTGRAGRKGTAYTFISPETEEQYAPVLVKAMRQSEQAVPAELQQMADAFMSKIGSGEARWASSGFGGTGFKFDPSEKNKQQKMADMQRRQYEVDQGLRDAADFFSDDESGDEDDDAAKNGEKAEAKAAAAAAADAASSAGSSSSALVAAPAPGAAETPLERAKRLAAQLAGGGCISAGASSALVAHTTQPLAVAQALAQAKKFAEKLGIANPSVGGKAAMSLPEKTHFTEEVTINEYPQKARFKITRGETIDDVSEKFSVAIISRGSYVAPGKKPGPNEKKLYLSIEGHSELAVSGARREIIRILNEETMRVGLDSNQSRYSVV